MENRTKKLSHRIRQCDIKEAACSCFSTIVSSIFGIPVELVCQI